MNKIRLDLKTFDLIISTLQILNIRFWNNIQSNLCATTTLTIVSTGLTVYCLWWIHEILFYTFLQDLRTRTICQYLHGATLSQEGQGKKKLRAQGESIYCKFTITFDLFIITKTCQESNLMFFCSFLHSYIISGITFTQKWQLVNEISQIWTFFVPFCLLKEVIKALFTGRGRKKGKGLNLKAKIHVFFKCQRIMMLIIVFAPA
jgi:hypothetical protein